jgi:flagellar basal body-associated protein FliL
MFHSFPFGTSVALLSAVNRSEMQPGAPEKSASKTKWMVLGGITAALAALATVQLLRASREKPKGTVLRDASRVQSVLHLDTFVMNLADPDEKAYLRVGIDLGLGEEGPGKAEEGGAPVALVRDTILGVLAQCKPDELLRPEGKAKLKADLVEALRQRAPALSVEEVYFTEFLIQR